MNSDLENWLNVLCAIIIIFPFSFFFRRLMPAGNRWQGWKWQCGRLNEAFHVEKQLMKVFEVEKSAASLEWIRAFGMPIKSDNINNSNLLMFALSIRPIESTTKGDESGFIQSLSKRMERQTGITE